MLKLYYGREDRDTNGFLYEQIRLTLSSHTQREKVILLVPDQYTLQAERDAFYYLEAPGLMDLEILSQSRLGTRILSEVGGAARLHIDKQGRHILLSEILRHMNGQLEAFSGMERSQSFIALTNDLISELKQFNTSPEELDSLAEELQDRPILARKLRDLRQILSLYNEKLAGRYVDTEDYMDLVCRNAAQSALVAESAFWVSGFHAFTPKMINLLKMLISCGRDVHVLLSGEGRKKDAERKDGSLFRISHQMADLLIEYCADNGIQWAECSLDEPRKAQHTALEHLERELYSYPPEPLKSEFHDFPIRICGCGNFYGEAESAAGEILHLVRDRGMRYQDIAVICNDMEVRGPMALRTFRKYGIPAFADEKRSILQNPAVTLVTVLPELFSDRWRFEDVFCALKTGFLGMSREDREDLENYCIQYRIQGGRWKKPFQYGTADKGEAHTAHLNELRESLTEKLGTLEKAWKKSSSAGEKTAALYLYLRDELELPHQISALAEKLQEHGDLEAAEEMVQAWDVMIRLFDQIVELTGPEEMDLEEYGRLLKTGFESVEIGLIPPASDQVLLGTMQRSRLGRVRALLVLGANDGLLPAGAAENGLLNQEERGRLMTQGRQICKDFSRLTMEEALSIYKNLSAPEDLLWFSYSGSDMEGRELRASAVLEQIRRMFPGLPSEPSLPEREEPLAKIQTPGGTLPHLAEALRNAAEEDCQPLPEWQSVWNWYAAQDKQKAETLLKGLFYRNSTERLTEGLARKLYLRDAAEEISRQSIAEDLIVSPSRLERFSRCPFSHFVLYGLKPEERRIFEVAGREMGDVYHECLHRLADELTEAGTPLDSPSSRWQAVTEASCRKRTDALIDEIGAEYKEGLLISGEEETYRLNRMKEVCGQAAWFMVQQVRMGHITEMQFEEGFGRNRAYPALKVPTAHGTVFVEGKIDRIDILRGDYVKITDYKSGKEHFDQEEVRGGWRLQLMLYLEAAMNGLESRGREPKPGGVFYFEVADPCPDAEGIAEEALSEYLEKEVAKAFRLDGVAADDPAVIDGIAGEFDGYSSILPVRKTSKGFQSNYLLSSEEFQAFRQAAGDNLKEICRSLAGGMVEAKPKKTKYETACRFCSYKNICNFEITFDGCRYDVVK